MGCYRSAGPLGRRPHTSRRGRDRDSRGSTALRAAQRTGGRTLRQIVGFPNVEFDDLFKSFEHTAYRLEVRDRYNAPGERVAEFLAGELDPDDVRAGWWLPNV